jgi:hypothetical protein
MARTALFGHYVIKLPEYGLYGLPSGLDTSLGGVLDFTNRKSSRRAARIQRIGQNPLASYPVRIESTYLTFYVFSWQDIDTNETVIRNILFI